MFFEIPEFQRPYSWQSSNVKEFLADLEECIEKNKKHYFGTVVQVEDTNSSYSNAIIDGQQRVTTSLLMIAAIYHMAKKDPSLLSDPETTVERIEYQYLINKDLDNNRVKLRTVTTDNHILQKIFDVEGDESRLSQDLKRSNIYQVYAEFRKYFEGKKELDKYINALGQFEIAALTLVAGDDNPQRVFESINSTGKPLTDGDKIRNFSLMLNDNMLREHVYKRYWSPIEEALTDTDKDLITDFFRMYIISKKSAIVKLDAVYPEFKKLFNKQIGEDQNMSAIDAFYSDINRVLKFYKLLKLADLNRIKEDPEFKEYESLAETIFKMRYIKVDLYIPYAISVFGYHADGKITDENLEEIFRILESYFSRRIIVNFYVTSVDRFMATLHRQVLDYMSDDPSAEYVEVLKYIFLNQSGQTQMPNDDDFEKAIRTYPFYEQHSNAIKGYVLAALNDGTKESKSTLHSIAEDSLQLTIEHVMPQTLTEDWREMLGDNFESVHSQYLHTLANLTLTGYNSNYSNKPYAEKMILEIKDKKTGELKKVGFAYSPLTINKWIASKETWNETTLLERQNWWVENLSKIWSLPETTFAPVKPDTTVLLLEESDLKGQWVRSIDCFGESTMVGAWSEALDIIAESIYDKHPDFNERVRADEFLARMIKTDNSGFNNSVEIADTGIYIDTSNDTNTKLRIIHSLGSIFDLDKEDIKAELVERKQKSED
jgi:uncharacterized protein with ParB-like and HNH nuclease domain